MAKPDLENGYLRIAHELFAAIMAAGFTKWESIVLREALNEIYGPRKAPTAFLFPTQIARHWSTHKGSIVRAMRTLQQSGVLIKTGENEFRFVKDYEKWTHLGEPRLGPFQVARCQVARHGNGNGSTKNGDNGASTHKPEVETTAPPSETTHKPEVETTAPPSETTAPPTGRQRRSPSETTAPPAHASKGTRAEERIENSERTKDRKLTPSTEPCPTPGSHAGEHANGRIPPDRAATQKRIEEARRDKHKHINEYDTSAPKPSRKRGEAPLSE